MGQVKYSNMLLIPWATSREHNNTTCPVQSNAIQYSGVATNKPRIQSGVDTGGFSFKSDNLLGFKIYCCSIQLLEQAYLQPQNAQGTDKTKSEGSKVVNCRSTEF